MDLIEKLNWRYATKRMNHQRIEESIVQSVLEAIRLSPSSYGIQPYNLLVVHEKELKKQIAPIAFNQPQITESSHLIIFSAWTNTTEDQINEAVNLLARERSVDVSELNGFREMVVNAITTRPQDINFHWAAKQAYLALGVAIVAATEYQIDATPMEGFDAEKLDRFLGLKEKGLKSTSILALGYRDEETDQLVHQRKVRKPLSELLTTL